MAYTDYGGKALLIETAKFPGSGHLSLTGKLGDVMKESVGTALSWIKSNAGRLGIYKQVGIGAGGVDVVEEQDH